MHHKTEMVDYKKLMILKIKIKTIRVVWETDILHYNQQFILQRPVDKYNAVNSAYYKLLLFH